MSGSRFHRREIRHRRTISRWFGAYARLRPGVTLSQARADCLRVAANLQKQYHPEKPNYSASLFSLRTTMVKDIRPVLLLLLGAAVLLLLITCANVAGLLVSRSIGRARETAVCIALGGSRGQLAVQYFLESLWISLAAAALGLLFSALFLHVLLNLATDYLPLAATISINGGALLSALLLAFFTATVSSLAPLWQAFRTPPNEILSSGLRASAGARSRNLSKALVVSEIALAFTLISAGALLFWHFQSLTHSSPGLNPQGLLTFRMSGSEGASSKAEQSAEFSKRVLEALDSIPGVTGAAVSNQIPLDGCCLVAQIFPVSGETRNVDHEINFLAVSPGYFRTLGIALQSGRLLTEQDNVDKIAPIVIDEAAAARYWPGRNAVGQLAHFNSPTGSTIQVVGIVATVHNKGLGETPTPEVYFLSSLIELDPMNFVVRSSLAQSSLTAAVRRAVAAVDPNRPIYAVQSMVQILSSSLMFQRIEWIITIFFAMAALLLASLGIYGLTAYSVRLRTTEMGTRMALGANANQILRLVTGDGLRLGGLRNSGGRGYDCVRDRIGEPLFQVHELSPWPYLFSIVIVAVLAVAASIVPAWRASILSPLVAIRDDRESVWQSARRAYLPVASAEPVQIESTLLTEFIKASRKAISFNEVYESSLQELLSKIQASSGMLLEKSSTGEFRCLAALPANSFAVIVIPESGFLLNRLKFYDAPMTFTSADLETSCRWAVEQKPQQVAELELLQRIGLRLAAPVRTKTELIGLLLFGARQDDKAYSLSEKTW